MKIIKKCSDDLLVLINDILDISKLEAGRLEVFRENFNIKNLIEELVDSFEELVKQKNIDFRQFKFAVATRLSEENKWKK
jgi:two-component system chemotaxis sensor kinase CheA